VLQQLGDRPSMILELVKKAGESNLSLKFSSIGNEIQCEVVGEDLEVWYSYSSLEAIDLFNTINDYLTSPIEFANRLFDSVPSLTELVQEIVVGV